MLQTTINNGENPMLKVAVIIWMILGPTLAGSALVVVVTVPSLYDQGMRLIPLVALAGLIVAAPLSVMIAKRIMTLTKV
jgi:hypothetical protein